MKAPIRRLDSLTHNDTAATKLINDNFEALQMGIEDSLSRTGKTPNFMDAVLDMNMNRIINIADPVNDYDLANKHYVDEQVALEKNRAEAAEALINGRIDGEINRATAAEGDLRLRIDNIDNTLSGFGDIVTHNADEFASSSDIGDGTITLTQGGVTKGTFTTNQSGNTTIELDAGSGDVGNGTITISQGGVVKGSFTVNQDSDTSINLDAVVASDNTIEIYPVTVSIAEGSTSATVDVTSSVDLSKNYLPIAVFQEVSTANVLKYCSYTHRSSAASVHFFSNGHIVGDTGVAVYLIPVESNLTTVRGLTNGLGEVTTALSGKQDSLSAVQLNAVNSGITSAKVTQYDSYATSIDTQNGTISNCILEIPQNIKLELNNNVLTAKSGSVLTDSGSTYQTITLTGDKTISISNTANLVRVIFATSSGALSQVMASGCVSGNTDSKASEAYHIWFDTNNKEVNYYGSDGTTASHRTYPLCIVETDSNGVAHFAKDSNGNDMIFNGAGFIGHHAFVYPNVKALAPNGFNDDGSLKGISITTNALQITELTGTARETYSRYVTILQNSGISKATYREVDNREGLEPSTLNLNNYIKDENVVINLNGMTENKIFAFIKYAVSGTTVTDFTIRQPYEGARNLLTDDIEEQIGDIDTALTTIIGA